jgi:hypothetical protein
MGNPVNIFITVILKRKPILGGLNAHPARRNNLIRLLLEGALKSRQQ